MSKTIKAVCHGSVYFGSSKDGCGFVGKTDSMYDEKDTPKRCPKCGGMLSFDAGTRMRELDKAVSI